MSQNWDILVACREVRSLVAFPAILVITLSLLPSHWFRDTLWASGIRVCKNKFPKLLWTIPHPKSDGECARPRVPSSDLFQKRDQCDPFCPSGGRWSWDDGWAICSCQPGAIASSCFPLAWSPKPRPPYLSYLRCGDAPCFYGIYSQRRTIGWNQFCRSSSSSYAIFRDFTNSRFVKSTFSPEFMI